MKSLEPCPVHSKSLINVTYSLTWFFLLFHQSCTAPGAPTRHHGLEDTPEPAEWREQVLHSIRAHLAVGGVRLPRAGVRGGRGARVGG